MTAQEIRKLYLDYFKTKKHAIIPRALLVPQNDSSTLFTSSGMQPLVPYLLGEAHPLGNRLVDSQTCLRAQDIPDVGDNRHTTFFEMLGNWSLGDYFKKEQLGWFFEFLVDKIGLDPNKLYVTCFIGSEKYNIVKDTESAKIWQELFKTKNIVAKTVDIGSEEDGGYKGMQDGRIFYYDDSKNWWCRAGGIDAMPSGEPGGPDSEVFYEFDFIQHDSRFGKFCHPNCDCGRFMEIGNSVFMEYLKTKDNFVKLPNKNVDFGGGLERIAAASENVSDVFEISLLRPIIDKLEILSEKKYQSHQGSMRVIADHLRAAVFLAADTVIPSNKTQGYVMRRLIRRAIRFAFDLGIEFGFFENVVPVIISLYINDFPELKLQDKLIVEVLTREEKIFAQTLKKGLNELNKLGDKLITGQDIFKLYDTYGFPVELSVEEVFRLGYKLEQTWQTDFDKAMKLQRDRSRTAGKGVFKGGLGGNSEIHKKYHTATHLMYRALKDVLGEHVTQYGSNITEDRLRFDFSHPKKMTSEEIKKVEDIVNQQINNDLQVSFHEYSTKKAINELGAVGAFGDRYGEVVKVYSMQGKTATKPFSFEICGGPHVEHTAVLKEGNKKFKIIKEESSSAGIRRIKAVLI